MKDADTSNILAAVKQTKSLYKASTVERIRDLQKKGKPKIEILQELKAQEYVLVPGPAFGDEDKDSGRHEWYVTNRSQEVINLIFQFILIFKNPTSIGSFHKSKEEIAKLIVQVPDLLSTTILIPTGLYVEDEAEVQLVKEMPGKKPLYGSIANI